jgi:hypothetical protein
VTLLCPTQRNLIFLEAMSSTSGNRISEEILLLSLLAEILRLIALNLNFEDLVQFQNSKAILLAATSDGSFYYEYCTKNCPERALKKLSRNENSSVIGKVSWNEFTIITLNISASFTMFTNTSTTKKSTSRV